MNECVQGQLAALKAEAEASAGRSMQLIERLVADKDALAGRVGAGRERWRRAVVQYEAVGVGVDIRGGNL